MKCAVQDCPHEAVIKYCKEKHKYIEKFVGKSTNKRKRRKSVPKILNHGIRIYLARLEQQFEQLKPKLQTDIYKLPGVIKPRQTCNNKQVYTKKEAITAKNAREKGGGRELRIYQCYNHWHLTHKI